MEEVFEQLIDAINLELEAGNWAEVVRLTVPLHQAALEAGETLLAALVEDLHCIAQDALMHPVEVAQRLAP